jgi:Ca2+-transporting ATPase
VRGGEQQRLSATELVPGDLVLLQSGDKVPADLRLLRARELRADESALTGESVPVEKDVAVMDRDTPLADRHDMAFASSLVTYGTGAGLVVATGDATEVGRISELIAEARSLKTPLTKKIDEFSKVLLVVILALAGVTFVVGLLRGDDFVETFKASIALAVAAIPEGLPAVVTITLAIGVGRMARRQAVIRKLPAVEALGSTTVICTDKTGTLTENQMTVRRLLAGGTSLEDGTIYEVDGNGYAPQGSIRPAPDAAALELLRAGLLCNDSALVEQNSQWDVAGDPTEGALLTAASKGGLQRSDEDAALPRLDAIPFESAHQYMATLHRAAGKPGADDRVVYVKGAVEKVLARCDGALVGDGRTVPLDLDAVQRAVDAFAADGLRVLAFALRRLDADVGELERRHVSHDLTFLGLQAMLDPPRPAATSAVAACRQAGVVVKMITGDHGATAAAIAAQVGIVDGPGAAVVTGAEMAELRDRDLIEVAADTSVFARVTPEQKLRLVEALQARGNVVAMTGDGVNDAPALKQADIGVAMGIGGTDVAKEAADMVLTDDDFATIEAAVEEGRGVFDNLVKFITFAIPTNIGQGLVLLTAIFLGLVLPILPLQILWVNMVTAVLLGTGLAFELKEPGIMTRPPRPPGSRILSRGVIVRVLAAGVILLVGAFALFAFARAEGLSDEAARTVAVNTFMSVQLFYLFACRSLRRSLFTMNPFSNRLLVVGVVVTAALQLLFTYADFMNAAFDTEPIAGMWWPLIVGNGVAAMVVMDLVGIVLRRLGIE